jgi:16S rRNA (uracil1498-N3)-methyltransferase
MPRTRFSQPPPVRRRPLAAGETVALDAQPEQLSRQCAAACAGEPVLVFNGRDGEWQAEIAGRKRPDSLEILSQTRPQDRLPDIAYVFRAAEARPARLHGAEGGRDGRSQAAAG